HTGPPLSPYTTLFRSSDLGVYSSPVLALALATAITTAPLHQITSVGRDFPATIDANQRYVFYLHGRIIEEHGLRPRDPRYGIYRSEEHTSELQSLRHL